MIATIPFIEECYAEFNAKFFGNILPKAEFCLSRARSYLGRFERHGRHCLIRISTAFDLPQETVEDVILHEMIHCWVYRTKLIPGPPHGRHFRAKMNELNIQYGRHISVRYKFSEGTSAPTRRLRKVHNICVSTFHDGSRGITIMSEAGAEAILRALPRRYRLASRTMVKSTDPFFNRYPLSRKPVIYKISEKELREHLQI